MIRRSKLQYPKIPKNHKLLKLSLIKIPKLFNPMSMTTQTRKCKHYKFKKPKRHKQCKKQ